MDVLTQIPNVIMPTTGPVILNYLEASKMTGQQLVEAFLNEPGTGLHVLEDRFDFQLTFPGFINGQKLTMRFHSVPKKDFDFDETKDVAISYIFGNMFNSILSIDRVGSHDKR